MLKHELDVIHSREVCMDVLNAGAVCNLQLAAVNQWSHALVRPGSLVKVLPFSSIYAVLPPMTWVSGKSWQLDGSAICIAFTWALPDGLFTHDCTM